MIVDRLANASLYRAIHPRLAAGFDFLGKLDPGAFAPGRTEIEGDTLFAIAQEYETRPREAGKWEAHRRYIDIQYLVEGEEAMGYAPLERLAVTQPYDAAKDCLLLQGEGSLVHLRAGEFAVFYPQDAHMPSLAIGTPSPVKKVVIKVLVG